MTDAPAQQLAGTVIEALTEIQSKGGDTAAYHSASSNIEASALFLLRVMRPQAARAVLFTAASAMEDAIKAENADTGYLQ
jgi:hypothetical protein